MFIYYNSNPNKYNISDCVRRSLSIAYDIDYKKVTHELRKIRKDFTSSKISNVPEVFEVFIHRHGCKEESQLILKSKEITVDEFSKLNACGTYLLIVGKEKGVSKHLTCLIDSNIYDTWDCLDNYVIKYYKVR